MATVVPSTGGDAPSVWTLDEFIGYGTAFLNPDRFDLEIKKNIQYFGPTSSPYLSWLQMVRRNATSEVSFSWVEDEFFTQRDLRATLYEMTGQDTNKIYWLQLRSGADWHAFEAAAKADTWTQYPLIYLTVREAATTKQCSFTIRMPAITYGTAIRDIISTDDGAPASETTVASAVPNAIVLLDCGPGVGSELVGGMLGEVEAIPADKIAGNIDPLDATNGLDQFTYASEACQVFLHVTEPNEAMKGFAQGSGLGPETRKKTRSRQNYVQIFKTPYSIANTLKAVRLRGGSELQRLRMKKMIQHKTEIERAMIFQAGGTLGTDWGIIASTDDNPVTRLKGLGIGETTQANAGVIVTKNAEFDDRFQFAASGATQSDWEDLCEAIFDDPIDSPSDTKVVFASPKWMKMISLLGLDVHLDASSNKVGQFVYGPREASARNRLGLRVTDVETSSGMLHFVRFPMFRGMYENYAMVVDFEHLEYRPLRPTTLVANAGDRTVDGQIDYYITEVGFEMRHESAHAILKLV